MIIHGSTVANWKELAKEHNWPYSTAEELAEFIDAFLEAQRKHFFNARRQASMAKETADLENDTLRVLQRMEELAPKLNKEQLEYLEKQLSPLTPSVMKAANVKAFKA